MRNRRNGVVKKMANSGKTDFENNFIRNHPSGSQRQRGTMVVDEAFTRALVIAGFICRMLPPAIVVMRMIAMMRMRRYLRGNFFMPDHMRAPSCARDNQRTKKQKQGQGSIHPVLLSQSGLTKQCHPV